MKEIRALLKIVSDGLKTVASGIEAVSETVNEMAESQTVEKPKPAAKPKAEKSLPAASKKKPAPKTARKASKKKAAKAPTAIETVFKIISGSKKGVDTTTLMKKTGFDRKKVANTVYKLGKQGKIKAVEKGVYVSA
jgi:hypothetical protein